MGNHTAHAAVRQQSVQARVIRADGTVVELGTVAYWHRNPVRRLAWRLGHLFRGPRVGRKQLRK